MYQWKIQLRLLNLSVSIAVYTHVPSHFYSMFVRLTGQAPVSSDWTVTPGERILEGLEEVEDAPTNDDVVVETHKATHLDR